MTAPENAPPPVAVKTRRGALLEVTKLVTNNDTKGKANLMLKGKEKDTTAAPEKAKPVLVNVRKPLQETTTTRVAMRRVTRSVGAIAPTTTATSTSKQPNKQAKKAVVPEVRTVPIIPEESEPEPAITKVEESLTTLVPPSSSLRKRSSILVEQTEEPPRVTKRLHTESKKAERKIQDDSQEEADRVAVDLILHDVELEPASEGQQWTDLDADDWEDPAMASEYVAEICKYWKRVEVR